MPPSDPPAASSPSSTAEAPSGRAPSSASPVAAGTEERRAALAKAAFDAVAPRLRPGDNPTNTTMWDVALTPVVPAAWPPDGTVVTYVYARGRSARLSDGEHVAAPFARIVSAPGAVDRVSSLGKRLVERGVQGVRPLGSEEIAVPGAAQLEGTVRQLSRAQVEAPPPDDLRASYCLWKSTNGVIAADVVAASPAFFRWLACKP